MGLADIRLSGYDLVVAVTQTAVNEGLADYLWKNGATVGLYYRVDADGNYVACSPDQAFYTFVGTLGLGHRPDGTAVDIVDLFVPKNPGFVRYNMTFPKACFTSTEPPYTSQQGSSPWILSFLVPLNLQPVNLGDLDPATQAVVADATNGLDDAFTLQRLYADLNTATPDESVTVTGLPTAANAVLTAIMQLYLKTLQPAGGLLFGITIHTPTASSTPTLMPTAVQFRQSQHGSEENGTLDPALDTLAYVAMTGCHDFPSPDPQPGFAWVDDPSQNGAAAVRHDLFLTNLVTSLNAALPPMCPTVFVHADPDNDAANQIVRLDPNTAPQQFSIVQTQSPGEVATFTYAPADVHDSDFKCKDMSTAQVGASYRAACTVSVQGSRVSLAGSITVSAWGSNSDIMTPTSVSMPATTYTWSCDLDMVADPVQNGRIGFVLANEDFDSAPTVPSEPDPSWFEKFLDSISGTAMHSWITSDLANLRGSVQAIIGDVKDALAAQVRPFVLPGGNAFAFSDVQVSGGADLVATVTYLSSTKA